MARSVQYEDKEPTRFNVFVESSSLRTAARRKEREDHRGCQSFFFSPRSFGSVDSLVKREVSEHGRKGAEREESGRQFHSESERGSKRGGALPRWARQPGQHMQ